MGDGIQTSGESRRCRVIQTKTTTRVALLKQKLTNTGADDQTPVNNGAASATSSVKSAAAIPTTYMNNDYTVGRINFGPRDSSLTLWELMEKFISLERWAAEQTELNEDLLLELGDKETELEDLRHDCSDRL